MAAFFFDNDLALTGVDLYFLRTWEEDVDLGGS